MAPRCVLLSTNTTLNRVEGLHALSQATVSTGLEKVLGVYPTTRSNRRLSCAQDYYFAMRKSMVAIVRVVRSGSMSVVFTVNVVVAVGKITSSTNVVQR